MNRRSKTAFAVGTIAVVATIAISVICVDSWTGLTGWAFAAMLWSEILFFGGLIFVEWIAGRTQQIMTRSALYVLLSAYAIVNIPICIAHMVFFKEGAASFAVIEMILLAAAAIAILIFLSASKSVHQTDQKTMTNCMNAEAMIARLDKLASSPKCGSCASTLKELRNELKFTDISSTVSEDAEIANAIRTIETELSREGCGSDETIQKTLILLDSLIAQRRISVRASKQSKI